MSNGINIDLLFDVDTKFTKEFLSTTFSKLVNSYTLISNTYNSKEKIKGNMLDSIAKEGRYSINLKKDGIFFGVSFHTKEKCITISIEEVYFRDMPENKQGGNENSKLIIELIKNLYSELSPFYVHGGYMGDETAAAMYDVDASKEIGSGKIPKLLWINIFSPVALKKIGGRQQFNTPHTAIVEVLPDGGLLLVKRINPLDC